VVNKNHADKRNLSMEAICNRHVQAPYRMAHCANEGKRTDSSICKTSSVASRVICQMPPLTQSEKLETESEAMIAVFGAIAAVCAAANSIPTSAVATKVGDVTSSRAKLDNIQESYIQEIRV
jgi:hypothetical protein